MASDTLKTSLKMGARTLNLQIMLPFPVTVRQKVLFFHDILFQFEAKIRRLWVPEIEI